MRVVQPHQHGAEQLSFVPVEAIQPRPRHTGGGGNLGHRCLPYSAFAQTHFSGVENPLTIRAARRYLDIGHGVIVHMSAVRDATAIGPTMDVSANVAPFDIPPVSQHKDTSREIPPAGIINADHRHSSVIPGVD